MANILHQLEREEDDANLAFLRSEIERLRLAIRRLADQDATLSVQGGNVTVTMDATLTDAEREAISVACESVKLVGTEKCYATLRSLLARCAIGHRE